MGTMRTSRGLARYGAIGAITVLLVGLALALMRVPAHAAPTVLTVVSTLDDHPGTTCAATCTLRDAVTTANGMTTDATNSVEIDLPSGTITLTQGVLTLGSATNTFSTVKGFSGTPGVSTIHQATAGAGVFATSNDAGLTTNFQDLTISGGRRTGYGGGVLLAGGAGASATFTNCILTDNTATVSGGAIAVTGTGTVSLTVTSSTVTGNQAQNSGAGLYFTGGGTLTIASSLFDTNSAGAGGLPGGQGGAIWKSGPAAAGISLSTFTNNSVVDGTSEGRGIGGAVFNDAGAMTISLSRFVGNTATAQGSALLQESSAGSIIANNNWWGSNSAPGSAVARDSLGSPLGAVPTTTAWLQLRNIAAPSQIQPGGTTTVTADLLGVTGTSTTPLAGGSLVGLAPLPAVFSNAVNGSLSAPSPQFVGGVATATFTGTAPGPASAGATADAATVSATVQVNPATTTTTVISSQNPSVFGQGVTFTATVTSTFAGGTPTGTVQFFVDGVDKGTATLASGSATSSQIADMTVTSHNVTATYAGNATYGVSTGTVTPAQTVNRAGTTTGVTSSANASAFGQPVAFTATVVPIAPGGGTPVGNVAFFLDGQPLETVALSDGSATTTPLSNLTVATHIVTAVYPDTVSYITSTGTLPGGQTVNKSDTTTTVGSSVTPSKFGQPVSFTATVSPTAPGAGTPAGNVSFFVDGTFLVTRTLVSGAATTASISNLAVGSHPVTATYAGNGTFNTNTSGTLAQVVDHADTTTTVTSGKTPTVFGEPVTFTATVLPVVPGAGTPTGQVQFFHDGSSFGTATVTSGQATSTISSLTAGTHPVTATYSGDPSFNLSTGATSQVVNPADTSVAVSSSLNASIVGQNVQFTATVTATAPGAGTPVGTVQFKDGSTNIGVSQTLDGGVASVSTSSFTFGTHPITAQYAGNANFNGSTGTLAGGQVVNRATSTTGVISSHNPSAIGQGVTFTATVTSTYDGGTPTGTMQFFVDGVDKGTVTMTSGSAISSQIANMAAGIHNVTATYGGNATYDVSTGTVTPAQVVGKAGTTTAIASTPNPSEVTETVTFTATVAATPPGVGTPAGDVQFFVDGSTSGSPATLDEGGVATLPGVAFSTPGAHPVTATYLGNIDFVTSTSSPLSQVVKGFRTTTAVTSPVNPSLYGQPVTFTATVDSGGHGTPTGTVQFSIDGSDVGGGVTLTAGAAVSLPIANASVGSHNVTATYLGAANFVGSASPPLTQVVSRANTTTGVTSSAKPSVFGQPVSFTATVAPIAPGGGTPAGTVEFFLDGQHLSTVLLSSGSASTAPLSNLTVANHTMTAVYADTDSYITSSGILAGGQDVNKADTTTTVTSSVTPSKFGQPVSFTATVSPTAPGAGTPSGSVSFYVDGGLFETDSLVGGVTTTASISSLPVGDNHVTATYTGDTNFNGSNSGTLTQTVGAAGTTTTVTSAKPTTVFGEPVSFTATVLPVAPGAGVPDGWVQFSADGTNFGSSVSLVSGSAVSPEISSLAAGMHTVTATYLPRFWIFCGSVSSFQPCGCFSVSFQPSCGHPTFKPSSGSTGQTVNQAGVTLTVSTDPNPSVFGQTVTFSTTVTAVAPGAGVPTGTVQFSSDGNPAGEPVAVVGGVATTTDTALVRGDRAIRATYLGDANFASGAFNTTTQTVNPAGTTTTVSASPSPSSSGQDVTFTATVVAVAPGAGTPTGGTVQFYVDGSTLGSPAAVSGGSGSSVPTSALSVGIHQVTATYTGDTNFMPSTSGVLTTQVVLQVDATNTVTSPSTPSRFGQPVQFVATLTGTQGTPTGTVQFLIDDGTFGTPVTLTAGVATSTATGALSIGAHTITARYGGSLSYRPDTGTVAHAVIPASTATTNVASSANPSAFGQSVQFSATVAPVAPGVGSPTGNVEFFSGNVSLGTGTLSGGSATSPATTGLSTGSHSVTARYVGDANFTTSTGDLPSDQVVDRSDSSTTVSSSQNASTFGQAVQFTAEVDPAGNGAGTPDGTVQFVIDGASFGSPVTLSGGSATSGSISSLTSGNHSVGAVYSSSSNFNSSSGTLSGGQTVGNRPSASVAVSSSKNPTISGETVVFSATVGPVAPAAGTPGGSVQFVIDGANAGGPAALSGGLATLSTGALAVGGHTVVANYSGDASFQSSLGLLAGGQGVVLAPQVASSAPSGGYWLFGSDGGVFTFGNARFFGSTGSMAINRPVVAMTATPSRQGYWLFASDGGVFAYGDAGFFGSTGAMHLNAPIVAMASTPTGQGYWLFASDGGVFAYGDAGFFGSGGGAHLNAPIVAMAATPSGQGYWLVATNGAVSTFGDAGNFGGLAAQRLKAPIVAMAATLSGQGYWLVASDGSVFGFGDAPVLGSLAGMHLQAPVVGFAATVGGQGYWLGGADGGIFSFGDAPFLGSMGGRRLNKPINGVTSSG